MADARAEFPEIAAVVDQIRAAYGQDAVVRAWVEDDDGYVLAGRRPPEERNTVYLDADAVVAAAQAFRDRINPALFKKGNKR